MKLYMLANDWDKEITETYGEIFATKAELQKTRACWKECGIVELTVKAKICDAAPGICAPGARFQAPGLARSAHGPRGPVIAPSLFIQHFDKSAVPI